MEAILETQEQLQALFLQKMDAFQTELQKSSSSAKLTLEEEFTSFREYIILAVKSLQVQISLLAQEVDSQEMRARRKIVLLHGVAELKDEDTAATAVDVVCKQLKIADFTTSDVSRCHRMGRSATDRPRPILLKVRDLSMRQTLWNAKTALKGTGITVSEFLTRPRHQIFMLARERFGINKCWTRDGFIFVLGSDGKRNRLSSLAELDRIETPAPKPKKPEAEAEKRAPRTTRRPPKQ